MNNILNHMNHQQVSWVKRQPPVLYQKVVLLSLAEREGSSDFTSDDPLLLISRPCNRPRGSLCSTSERE